MCDQGASFTKVITQTLNNEPSQTQVLNLKTGTLESCQLPFEN